jgi:hypothetical protein
MDILLISIVGFGLIGSVLCADQIVVELQRRDAAINESAHQVARTNFDDERAYQA